MNILGLVLPGTEALEDSMKWSATFQIVTDTALEQGEEDDYQTFTDCRPSFVKHSKSVISCAVTKFHFSCAYVCDRETWTQAVFRYTEFKKTMIQNIFHI